MINPVVLKMDLRRSFKSMLLWGISLGLTLLLIILIYPLVEEIYKQIPEEFQNLYEMFGGIPANVTEYFSTEGGMILQLLSAIYATILGFNTITREEKELAADIIYTLPVTRTTFYLTKLLSVYLQIIIFSITILIFTVGGIVIIDPTGISKVLVFTILNTITLIMIASIGFSFACFIRGTKSTAALLIPLVLYIFQILSSLTENKWLIRLKYLTPFTFSNPVEILKEWKGMEWISFLLFLTLSVSLILLSLKKFRKREMVL